MSRASLLPVVETPKVAEPDWPAPQEIDLLDDFTDDEDATIADQVGAARGTLTGIILGAALWAAILTLIIRH